MKPVPRTIISLMIQRIIKHHLGELQALAIKRKHRLLRKYKNSQKNKLTLYVK